MEAPLIPDRTAAGMSTDAIAEAAGVLPEEIAAVRAGIPWWRLEQPGVARKIAATMGSTEDELRAAITARKDAVQGRGAGSFAGAPSFPSMKP